MGKNNSSKPRTATASSGDEALHTAARSGDLKAVLTICATNPLAVNNRDKHSRTPLHLAAWSGHVEIVNYLCKNKADAGAAAMDDMGAIHFAAQKGHLEVIKTLLASGVSVKSFNRKGMNALHYAAQGSNLDLVKYLVKKGSNIDTKNKAGKTAIDLASSDEIRKFLVECKSAPNKTVLDSSEKGDQAKKEPSSSEKVEDVNKEEALEVDKTVENGEQETLKRKDEDVVKDDQQQSKKSRVALNHLLAADDIQEEEDEDGTL